MSKWGEDMEEDTRRSVSPKRSSNGNDDSYQESGNYRSRDSNDFYSANCRFYNSRNGCRNGSQCKFVHHEERNQRRPSSYSSSYKTRGEQTLHDCPNDGCSNQCFGRMCKECHFKLPNSQSRYNRY